MLDARHRVPCRTSIGVSGPGSRWGAPEADSSTLYLVPDPLAWLERPKGRAEDKNVDSERTAGIGLRGVRFVLRSPVAKVAFGIGAFLLILSIVGFGVALKHRVDAKSVENRLIERGYPLETDAYELDDAHYSASRASGIAFLLLLGATAAFFTGSVAGLPTKKRLEQDKAAQRSLSESKAGVWHHWTRGRALAAGVGVTISFVLGPVLWIVGSLRATRFINSSFPNQPGELRGAIEFILGTALMIAAPTIVTLLRRTTFWKWAAGAAVIVIGGTALLILATWPPESSWF